MGPVGHAHVTIDQLQIHGTRPYAAGRIERIGPRTNQRGKKRQKEIDICLNCPRPTCSSKGSGTCPILLKGKEKAEVNNEDIRSAIKSAGLKTKQVYEALHIPHSTWSLWMHRELSAEFREKIFQTIAELKRPKEAE